MDNLIILGGGGHAKVLINIIKRNPKYNILGYTDVKDNGDILGIQYLGNDNYLLDNYDKNDSAKLVIGIGKTSSEDPRKQIYNNFLNKSFSFPRIISEKAIVNEDVVIGRGTVIMDGAVINPSCKLGEAVIINTSSSIDHDCSISSFTHIAPGVTLSGGVKIGENCMIGTGANLIQNIKLTENVIIGAGSVVLKDICEPGVYVGNPARRIK